MWQNRCFIYIGMYLLTLYHHSNGFVNLTIAETGHRQNFTRGSTKARENNLRETKEYYVILPYGNCGADVQEYAEYTLRVLIE